MIQKFTFLSLILFIFTSNSFAQITDKQPLSAKNYNEWKSISKTALSNDGKWISYEINPQKGDGYIYLYSVDSMRTDSFKRGTSGIFTADNQYLIFTKGVQYDTLRQLKLRKTPKGKMPKDTLCLKPLGGDTLIQIPMMEGLKYAENKVDYIAFINKAEPVKTVQPKKKWKCRLFKSKKTVVVLKEIEQEGDDIKILQPSSGRSFQLKKVDEYEFNYYGNYLFALYQNKLDSLEEVVITRHQLDSNRVDTLFKTIGFGKDLSIDRSGNQAVWFVSTDTLEKSRNYEMVYWNHDSITTFKLDSNSASMPKGFGPSTYQKPYFDYSGSALFFGIAPLLRPEPKDTLLEDEKCQVDVWNYQDDWLQPQQNLMAKQMKRNSFLSVFYPKNGQWVQLEDSTVSSVRPSIVEKTNKAVGIDSRKYAREMSWDDSYNDYYINDLETGINFLVVKHLNGTFRLSPKANYAVYFEPKEKKWYSVSTSDLKKVVLNQNLNVNFYDEDYDMAGDPSDYGISGWYADGNYVVINDRYDLWKFRLDGSELPVNLTKGYGRKHDTRFSSIDFDPEEHIYFDEENPKMLMGFNEKVKSSGYFNLCLDSANNPYRLIHSHHSYYQPIKAKNSETLAFRRSSFTEFPNLLVTNTSFKDVKCITNANPQQQNYLWGTVELVNWKAFDGTPYQGLLYKPENFDSTNSYPMIVYFYEKYSDDIHNHYIPRPSYSTINFTEYTSNGYLVFVPDITYKIGHPAQSAYNSIVSGTEFLKKNSWVNAKKIGIQGQSWGGYQVAMLVTMTNIFACGEAGAPVSNMTSAYGGIRWGSGMSRAFQYEKTQSRIGKTLWESTDLYIENSPLFHAPKVQTPLLIMHNDMDGAVPWYQGIEYFSALRRLDKKVWMLTYNDDDHNLMKWPNRVDLSIRMQQFFDHYLKEAPMPVWMSKGIPAWEKGKNNGYQLSE